MVGPERYMLEDLDLSMTVRDKMNDSTISYCPVCHAEIKDRLEFYPKQIHCRNCDTYFKEHIMKVQEYING